MDYKRQNKVVNLGQPVPDWLAPLGQAVQELDKLGHRVCALWTPSAEPPIGNSLMRNETTTTDFSISPYSKGNISYGS